MYFIVSKNSLHSGVTCVFCLYEWEIFCVHVSAPVQCPTLTDPANGALSYTGISVGDTANYTCFPDYEPVGANNLTCRNDGQWSADLPMCRRKLILLL